jgi:tripartite ATP-independent transporter DctP family solute receptor
MKRALALLTLLFLFAAGCTPRAQDHEQVSPRERLIIKFSHVVGENTPKGAGAQRFAQAMKERTGGRVEVQVFANSQLYKDGEELTALKDGSIQMIAPSTSKLTTLQPEWAVFDLPYLFAEPEDAQRLFTSRLGLDLRQGLEARGFLPLVLWPNGFKQFTNRMRPLERPEDFRGLRFRVQPGTVLPAQFSGLGAFSTVATFDALYAALEQQEVDGQENTLSNIYTRSLHEVQPYLTISDHGLLAYVVLVNARWWQGLEPDLREEIREALAEATRWVWENAPRMNEEALAKLSAMPGLSVHGATEEERARLRAAMAPAYAQVEQQFGKEFLSRVLESVRTGR